MMEYLQSEFLYSNRSYYSLNSIKRFMSPREHDLDTVDELKDYYKNILLTSKTYPTMSLYEIKSILEFKNRYGYTTEEIDELLLKIDNQAFSGLNYKGKLGSILESHDILKRYHIPIDKTPKDLYIYCNKASALRGISRTVVSNVEKYNMTISVSNFITKQTIIDEVITPRNYKLLDEILLEQNIDNKYSGKLKLCVRNKSKVYKDYKVVIYSPMYSSNKIIELTDLNTNEVLVDEEEIKNKIQELAIEMLNEKEVATNE